MSPSPDPAWLLVEEGFNLAREHEIESLFAVANGYVGTRGSLAEGSRLSAPATFLAGVFDTRPESSSVPELVLAPDWMRLRALVDGHELRLEDGEALEHRRVLDLRQGILWRDWLQRDPSGRITRILGLRLASLADRHVLLQSISFTPDNYSGRLLVESRIEPAAGAESGSPRARAVFVPAPPVMLPTTAPMPSRCAATLSLRVPGTGTAVAFAAASELRVEGGEPVNREVETEQGRLVERWELDAEIGKTYRLDRLVAIYTSRDAERPAEAASTHLDRLCAEGVQCILTAHVRAWMARWQAADVEVEGDAEAQRALRFAAYHLISAANPEDERVSVGARALTGETYKGHVFWDTDVFLLPFYIYTHPASARALLMYRYHTLPAARAKAQAFGYQGAFYPWESADTGNDVTPTFVLAPDGKVMPVRNAEQEIHITADVAYAVWQYWQATADDAFFRDAGAEMVLETARFWASRGRLAEDGRYHIRQVIGPDEYHEGVDDNAYTNLMARWNLERGAETARLLEERWPERWQELSQRLAITAAEPGTWLQLVDAMYAGFDPATGLYQQFRGYFALEEIDLRARDPRTTPIDVLRGRERIGRSKVVKQADLIMALYLLWEQFPPEVRERSFRYYEPRTAHGSSLSPAIHALIAARLGDLALAERYFRQAADIDLANNLGNAAGGVHVAALGGLWQAVIFGFAGLRPGADGLVFDPHLPRKWRTLRFPLEWRGRRLRVKMGGDPLSIEVRFEGEDNIPIAVAGERELVAVPGLQYRTTRAADGWSAWEAVPP